MELFTTGDVERLLKIKRNRLKEWIIKGYIIPTRTETIGPGEKALFNRWGLYCLKCFSDLLMDGFSREIAAGWVKILYGYDPYRPPTSEDEKLLKFIRTVKKDGFRMFPFLVLTVKKTETENKDEIVCSLQDVGKMGLNISDRAYHIINFKIIKDEVDFAIGN